MSVPNQKMIKVKKELCNGKNYYATKTARDREVVQPMVLEGLQWKVMRVWTLDWFQRPDSVIQRIEQALK